VDGAVRLPVDLTAAGCVIGCEECGTSMEFPRGRKIINAQFAAVMLSAFLLTTQTSHLRRVVHQEWDFCVCGMPDVFFYGYHAVMGKLDLRDLVFRADRSMLYGQFGHCGAGIFSLPVQRKLRAMLLKIIPLFVVAAIFCYNLIFYAF
jgi:hypothetical protein